LLSLILLLQRKGPLTGRRIARELGVSLRTVYRDIDAVGTLGVPIVATSGPHGGYRIMEGYRNEFARLSTRETNAILAAAAVGPLAMIGQGATLQGALQKLAAQRPALVSPTAREGIDPERVMIDPGGQESDAHAAQDPTVLALLVRAVSEHRVLDLTLAPSSFSPSVRRHSVEPLGLVNRRDQWYLVCNDAVLRVRSVDTILTARLVAKRFAPPADFRLSEFWARWRSSQRALWSSYRVVVETQPLLAESVTRFLSGGSAQLLMRPEPAPVRAKGTAVRIECGFASYEDARARVLGLGGAARIVEPEALRHGVVDFARQALITNGAHD
jgi:predicted DNA-binding transcriptional regulator YafY